MKKLFYFAMTLLFAVNIEVGSVCQYCTEIDAGTNPIQTCSAIGSGVCGNYYISGRTACCSETPGPACNLEQGPDEYFIYRFSNGTCSGIYRCSQSTSSSCQGDFIIASSSNCAPYGTEYVDIIPLIYCN